MDKKNLFLNVNRYILSKNSYSYANNLFGLLLAQYYFAII